MPGMGMRLEMGLYQRMEQRLALEMRQELGPADWNARPFRTDEEERQVSQYEIIRSLEKVLDNGEFFDTEHFELEINRAVFGNKLQADLGVFGRDLSDLISLYKSTESTAKRVVKAVGHKKQEEKKEAPGQIVSGLKKAIKSKYFKDEPKQKLILKLAEELSEREADTAEALDIVGKVSDVENQKDLAHTTVGRLDFYSRQDSRIIPFANKNLQPILRAIEGKESLSPEQSTAVFSEVIEYLYMLDREGRVSGGSEKIAELVAKHGPQILLDRTLPLPLRAFLESLVSKETVQKLSQTLSGRDFEESRELKRRVYKGLFAVEETEGGEAILGHLAENVKTPEGIARILEAVDLIHKDPEFSYPFSLTEEDKILRNLRLHLVDKSLKRLGLADDKLELYLERLGKDSRLERVGKILTTLANYSHYQTQQGLGLIREILIAEIDGNFNEWRYSHNLAEDQLAVLEDDTDAWRENKRVKRLVGELDALQSHIDSVKHTLPKIAELYAEQYKDNIGFHEDGTLVLPEDYLENLEGEIEGNEEALRDPEVKGHEKKDLGHQTSLLREKFAYAKLLKSISGLSTENYTEVLGQAEDLAKKRSKNPLYESAKWIRETLDQPVYRSARKIEVVETDDLEDILRMGESPVAHCQNWKVNSSLNGSLLSFVADANKKLYHITNGDDRPIAMSMVRLVDWDETPTILVENLYANEWSTDYGIALIGSLADKAMNIHRETGKQVRLAVAGSSGYAGHQTNVRLGPVLDIFSKKYNVEIFEETMNVQPPRSKNEFEYWDCGVGKVRSGSSVSVGVRYVNFGNRE